MPNGRYKGQKFKKLVATNISAKSSATMANVPVSTLEKYKTAITAAKIRRMYLSVDPMFLIMIFSFLLCNKIKHTEINSL